MNEILSIKNKIENCNISTLEETINELAQSNIPNKFFLYQFAESGIFPKWSWDILANIILRRGEKNIQDVIGNLFLWLQDMNWPGAQTIWDFLLTIDPKTFDCEIEKKLFEAIFNRDVIWFVNLVELNTLKYGITKLTNKNLQNLSEEIMALENSAEDCMQIEKLQSQLLKDYSNLQN